MSLLLREIQQSRWLVMPAWVGNSDLPAECLTDLRAETNKLSVWEIKDSAHLRRIMAAVAARWKQSIGPFDYYLFRPEVATKLGLQIAADEKGKSADSEVNKKWHRNVNGNLSGIMLVRLGRSLYDRGWIARCERRDLLGCVDSAINAGHFRRRDMSDAMIAVYDEFLAAGSR